MKELVAYLQGLTVTQGRMAGEALTVLPWQGRFLEGVFADGVQSAALSVARGNGKTALLSGVACAALDGPLAVPRGETVIVASSFEQARIAFEHVMAFKGDTLADKAKWKVWDTAQTARIENRRNGARVICIASDPRRAHGRAPVLILADEPAQWPPSTGERMVAALETAAGKQPHCRFVALGTRPAATEHWFAKALEGGADYAQCHAATEDDDPFDRATWYCANPSLAAMPDLLKAIEREAERAKLDAALLPAFKALRLNMGVGEVRESVLLEAETWRRIEGNALRLDAPVWGLDLGTSAAMSAVAAYWPASGALDCLAAFPRQPTLHARGLADGVGDLYLACAERGELIQCGEHASDLAELFEAALAKFGRPAAIAADRWRDAEAKDALAKARVPVCPFEVRGQGYRDGAADVRAFRRACLEKRVTPAESLLLRSAMAEARTVTDPAGNEKLAKSTQGGRRGNARDDAAAAAILAVAAGVRQGAKPRRRVRSVLV